MPKHARYEKVEELDSLLAQNAEIVNNANNIFFSKFDYQTLIAQSVTTIVGGSSSRFPQSAVIDYENNKFYIARQTTGAYQDQMIFEYDMQGNLLRNKPVPIGVQVYIEGLVYFRNASNQICFIVPVEKYGVFGIFNFDTGILESQFNMDGNNKIGFDNQKRYFLCGKSDNPTLDQNQHTNGIHLYDLESVKAGTPTLVKTVELLTEEITTPKIQGLTMIDDVILLGRGADIQLISALDINGNILYNVSHDNKDIISLVGGNPSSSNQLVESEGISWIIENGVTCPVVFNCTQGKASLVKLTTGTKLKRQVYQGVNPLRAISDNPTFKLLDKSGSPTITVNSGEDIYQKIFESIKQTGVYTMFANSNAIGNPTRRSGRAIIQVSHISNDMPSSVSIIMQDFVGTVTSNYYDGNTGWQGWTWLGGNSIRKIGDATFDPFTARPGVYETDSQLNAPVNNSTGVKTYTITHAENGRKTIRCHYSDAGTVYYATFHTSGVFKGWKKVGFVDYDPKGNE